LLCVELHGKWQPRTAFEIEVSSFSIGGSSTTTPIDECSLRARHENKSNPMRTPLLRIHMEETNVLSVCDVEVKLFRHA
jgi:hypothetical protein